MTRLQRTVLIVAGALILPVLGAAAFEQLEDRRPCHNVYGPLSAPRALTYQELRQLIVTKESNNTVYVRNDNVWITVTSITITGSDGSKETFSNLDLRGQSFPAPGNPNIFDAPSIVYSVQSATGMMQGC